MTCWGCGEKPGEVGKPVGSDLMRNKRSLPILLGLKGDLRERVASALVRGLSAAEAETLAKEMEAAGVRQECEERAGEYVRGAAAALGSVELEAAAAGKLRRVVEGLVGRKK